MLITKLIEWDMGHRIPNHKSKCKNLHGHRYKLEVTVEGELKKVQGSADEGMVIDFGDLKEVIMTHVHDVCDHGFMYSNSDTLMDEFYTVHPDLKYIKVDFIPTAENIASWISKIIKPELVKHNIILKKIKLWETPTSFSEVEI